MYIACANLSDCFCRNADLGKAKFDDYKAELERHNSLLQQIPNKEERKEAVFDELDTAHRER